MSVVHTATAFISAAHRDQKPVPGKLVSGNATAERSPQIFHVHYMELSKSNLQGLIQMKVFLT